MSLPTGSYSTATAGANVAGTTSSSTAGGGYGSWAPSYSNSTSNAGVPTGGGAGFAAAYTTSISSDYIGDGYMLASGAVVPDASRYLKDMKVPLVPIQRTSMDLAANGEPTEPAFTGLPRGVQVTAPAYAATHSVTG